MDGPSKRVHEIIVHIGYASARWTQDQVIELRDYLEAAVAQEFQIEQAHVDVRLRTFGPLDDYYEPLYVRIIAQHEIDQSEQDRVSRELEAVITQHFHTTFRLWVEFAPANFTEVTEREENV